MLYGSSDPSTMRTIFGVVMIFVPIILMAAGILALLSGRFLGRRRAGLCAARSRHAIGYACRAPAGRRSGRRPQGVAVCSYCRAENLLDARLAATAPHRHR